MNDCEAGSSGAVTDDFDVFLNHRGPDVKARFVAHLEEALRHAGFRPFLDARSLMKGNPALKSIDQALDMAKVHVAVVSRGYAQSKYCLIELVAMLRSGKPVIPVFYDVEPVDLRWVENGPFAEAFEKHKLKGRSEKQVGEWRDALGALANITGFRMADYEQNEAMLKVDVVNAVARLIPLEQYGISNSGPRDRITQMSDSVYILSQPDGPPDIELVFIHGLQLSGYEEAFWRTWTAGENDKDGREICWPIAWLREEFPRARIWSIKYDLRDLGTTYGFLFGGSLVQEMVEYAGIGQRKNCPVMFVCHSIGGLVAKGMVIEAHMKFGKKPKYVKFLQNIRGFHFYATPHEESKVADLAAHLPHLGKMVDLLSVIKQDLGRLNDEFERIERDHYTKRWRFSVVAETHITTCYGFNAMVVEEASARHGYDKFRSVGADHFGVCKPRDKESSSYLALKNFIVEVEADNKRRKDMLLELPSYVVGMDSRVKVFNGKWEGHSAVALVGIGGVGKTTLSKYIFISEEDNFEGHCFLVDVNSRGNIEACQKQLFRDLCGEIWDENESVDFHLEKIKEYIMSKKVLLVVDDVGDKVNMRALQVPAFIDGTSGSKVIVTTRRRDLLFDFVNQEGIMDMNPLSEVQALELFSYYAFNGVEKSVKAQFDGLAKEIIKACGGLPLNLEIIGQFCRSKWKDNSKSIEKQLEFWDEILRRLTEAKSFDGSSDDWQLWARLKISFDDLNKEEQNIFLLTSLLCRCSIFREDPKMLRMDTLEQVVNSPLSIQNLTNRSFIKWSGNENMLVIHDQLQDMAHHIVMDRGGGSISFKWDTDEGLKSLLKNIGGLQKLQVLKLYYSNFLKTISNTISIGNSSHIPMIDLSYCEGLKSLPESIGGLQELQVLKLFQCDSLETLPTAIGNLSFLTELDLSKCYRLKMFPESIGGLQKLQVLNISYCISLKTLPISIGKLYCLTTLDLSYCEGLKSLPESIGGLQKLQVLKLFQCDSLETLPTSIGNLSFLTMLDLSECYQLERLPESIGGLEKLQVLNISNCISLETLPISIGKLYCLTTLDLSYCEGLKSLPESIGGLQSLQVLYLFQCDSLEILPISIGNLFLLITLDLSYCEGLKSLPENIGGLLKLQVLNISNCISLETLPISIGKLYHLTTLDLSYCTRLKSLPENIGGLQNLQELYLFQCYSLEILPISIGNLSLLNNLDFSYCQKLESLPESIGGLQNLHILKLRGCYLLEKLPTSICNLSLLSELDLSECCKVKNLPKNIGGLQNLQRFKLFQCTSLESLPGSIEDLSVLMELDLFGCLELKSLPEISRLKKLQVLKFPASMEQKKQVNMMKEQLKQDHTVGEQEGGGRLRFGSKQFYNFFFVFFILLEPLLNTVGFLINHGRFVIGLLMQWVQIPAGTSGQQVSSCYKCRVKSKDLILGRFLGQGCSGIFYETTWSGSHENTGRLARKLFPGVKGDVFESEVVRLFEIADDPNIAKTFCWTVDNRSCSLVIEYVSDNLSNVMRKRKESLRKEVASEKIAIGTRTAPFQFPEGMDIVYQIAMGVRHLHSQGIYHGDLKPNNVLIDWEGDRMLVKLADFGLNKTKRRTTLISQRTLCAQMIEWSAPEIVEDYIGSMSEDLDYLGIELDVNASSVSYDKSRPEIAMEQADSYSFALLCAYILGAKVWDGNLSPNELRKQISTSRLRPKMPSECPDALASLISLCWDAEPKDRPTFSAICDRLEEIVKGQQWEKKRNLTLREQPEETIRQRARGEASAAGGTYDA